MRSSPAGSAAGQADDAEALLAALDRSGIEVRSETNTRHLIGDGPLRIVTDVSAVALHPDAKLHRWPRPRQWSRLRRFNGRANGCRCFWSAVESDAFG
jgi:hypothetical protein